MEKELKDGGSDIKTQIRQLEDEIANLCNRFIEDSSIHFEGTLAHIDGIRVHYGPCEKGKYPDDVLSISVDVHWSASYSKREIERMNRK